MTKLIHLIIHWSMKGLILILMLEFKRKNFHKPRLYTPKVIYRIKRNLILLQLSQN